MYVCLCRSRDERVQQTPQPQPIYTSKRGAGTYPKAPSLKAKNSMVRARVVEAWYL